MSFFKWQKNQRVRAGMAICLLPFMLAACHTRTLNTFDLPIPTYLGISATPSKAQILVPIPEALKFLDGQNILIYSATSVAYLKKAQWSDRLPNLIQARLAQAFENVQHFRGVGRPNDGLAIDYQILTDLRAFDVDVSSSMPRAQVVIGVRIMDDRTGTIIANHIFKGESHIFGKTDYAYIYGLNQAFEQVLRAIIPWVVAQI